MNNIPKNFAQFQRSAWEKNRGRPLSLEHRNKISASLKGKIPKNIKLLNKKAVKFKKSQIPWNKNIPLSQQLTASAQLERKLKISKTLKRLYKEGKRKNVWEDRSYPEEAKLKLSKSQKGEKQWTWKGGITKKRDMHSLAVRNWREKVFIRDGYTCKKCNKKGSKINAHHIKSWAKYPEFRFDVNNGLTLCKKCHIEVHTKC